MRASTLQQTSFDTRQELLQDLGRAVEALCGVFRGRPRLQLMVGRCLLNSAQATMELLDDGTTYVVTGDIPAMWLRDSSAQVKPYIHLVKHSDAVRRAVSGLLRRQAFYARLDPYANAFNREPNGKGHKDLIEQSPWVWERKYELDSHCYWIDLAHAYWKGTRDTSLFDADFLEALAAVISTWETEQCRETSPYRFKRKGCPDTDTLPCDGRGALVAWTGMIWSGFRPSDDACLYGYHIPSNMFAVVTLGKMGEILGEHYRDAGLVARAERLRGQIDEGIRKHGVYEHKSFGPIYAYEVDGCGGCNLMDDANVPSLLSIPYLGYTGRDDLVYRNTRRFILSAENPYYFTGRYASGVGSPHTPKGYVWPMSLIMQAITSEDPEEVWWVLDVLERTDGGTALMHESFDPEDPDVHTRPWFGWANSLFCELAWRVVEWAWSRRGSRVSACRWRCKRWRRMPVRQDAWRK